MAHDTNGLRILDASEALALLAPGGLGRIALTDRALPVILPVSFGMLDADIVFEVADGLLMRAAERRDIVCFETDHVDSAVGVLWSVVVTGQLGLASPDTVERAQGLGLPRWSPTRGECVRLPTEMISGHRTARTPAVTL